MMTLRRVATREMSGGKTILPVPRQTGVNPRRWSNSCRRSWGST